MQMTMTMESCCRCGQPILPGEPAMQTASVDIDDYGRAVSSREGIPPVGTLLRGRQGRRSRPQKGACSPLRRLAPHPTRPLRLAPLGRNTSHEGRRHDMNLGEFIDTYKEAIAQRVVESYPPLYRPSENGGTLPRLLRTPLGGADRRHQGRGPLPRSPPGNDSGGRDGNGKDLHRRGGGAHGGLQEHPGALPAPPGAQVEA